MFDIGDVVDAAFETCCRALYQLKHGREVGSKSTLMISFELCDQRLSHHHLWKAIYMVSRLRDC